jgi:hypothetical protein
MPNYSKIAGSLSELLAKLPKGSAAAQEAIRLEMELEAARQAAMYAPHTLPTEAGAEAIEKAKKITGKAEGGIVNLDDIVNEAFQRSVPKMGVGGGVKTAGQKLVSFIEKIAKEQKAAEKAGDIETALQKNKELRNAIQAGVNDPAMPRAKPLSDAEIQAYAERMAPQVEGKLTRGKTGAKTVAGKTQKQFEREKTLSVQRRVLPGQQDPSAPLPTMTMEDQKGGVLIGLSGDPTLARTELSGIDDVLFENPVTLEGGPRYKNKKKFWASNIAGATNLIGAGRRASEQYGGAPIYAMYQKMPEGFGFAQHYLDSLLQYTRPDQLPKAAREALEDDIRKGFINAQGKRVTFPKFSGFDDLNEVSLATEANSILRGHIADRLEKSKLYGLRPAGDVQFAVTHPELTNLETGAGGFTIAELPLNQKFTPSPHRTYTEDIEGTVLGQTRHPTPYDLIYRDELDLVRLNPKIAEEPFNTLKLLGPRQTIDEQLINEINEYQERLRRLIGKKDGGLATGGVPEKRDVSQLFPLKVPADNAELKPQPKYPLFEKASQGVQSIHDFVSAPFGYENPAGEMVSSFMEVPAIAKTLGNIAYDLPLTSGSGMTTDLRPEVSGAAFGLAPLVGPAVKTAKKAGKALAPTAAEMALDIASKYGVDPRMNIIKPKGGNWMPDTPEHMTERLKTPLFVNKTPEERVLQHEELLANPALTQEQKDRIQMFLDQTKGQVAADKWVDQKLNKYIKSEMGTESDPIRLGIERRYEQAKELRSANQKKLDKMADDIDKAQAKGKTTTISERDLAAARQKFAEEEDMAFNGLYHGTIPEGGWANYEAWYEAPVKGKRKSFGMPEEGLGTHPASRHWESTVDDEIGKYSSDGFKAPHMQNSGLIKNNPWLLNLPPDTTLYKLDTIDGNLEFRHMIDELKNSLDPLSNLPKHLKIAPKDLEKMTVDDVSALSGKINAWRNVQKTKTNLEIANNPATHTFKEYPLDESNPKGVSWRQIKLPEPKIPDGGSIIKKGDEYYVLDDKGVAQSIGATEREALNLLDREKRMQYVRDATKYEGDIMRHCVGGSSHCEPLISGKTELYTLRDAKGEPHVTIEVGKSTTLTPEKRERQLESLVQRLMGEGKDRDSAYREALKLYPESETYPRILEIKGKLNRKPKDEYIPFVQDFIKSGNWSDIADIHHTDLRKAEDVLGTNVVKELRSRGEYVPPVLDFDEAAHFHEMFSPGSLDKYLGGKEEYRKTWNKQDHANGGAIRMAEGGVINLDDLVHQAFAKRYAEGGAAYNTTPDMADGGQFIQGEAF